MTDWAEQGLTEEVVVVIVKPTPDSKLGVTLSSFPDDVPHPRVTGAPHRTALCCLSSKESPHPPSTLPAHWMAHLPLRSAPAVAAISAGGLVAASGKVLIDDVVVEVNGTPVSEDSAASDIIKSTTGDLTFLVRRQPALKKTSSMSKLNPFKRSNSKTGSKTNSKMGVGSKTNLIVPGAGLMAAPASPPAATAVPEAAADDGSDATATITLQLKRKNGSFGLGVREDNYVQEVDEGSGGHEAGIRVGDWVSLAAAETHPLSASSPRLHVCADRLHWWRLVRRPVPPRTLRCRPAAPRGDQGCAHPLRRALQS